MSNVILLEDETALREGVTEFLEAQGHCVRAVASVAEFAQAFMPASHEVAIVDLGLPDGDGLDVVRRMRRDGLRLGIIILTARAGTQARAEGLASGADYFLPKTIDLTQLSSAVTSLAGGSVR